MTFFHENPLNFRVSTPLRISNPHRVEYFRPKREDAVTTAAVTFTLKMVMPEQIEHGSAEYRGENAEYARITTPVHDFLQKRLEGFTSDPFPEIFNDNVNTH